MEFGAIQVLPWLYLCGYRQVDSVINKVDIWIDFRNELPTNLKINVPSNVVDIKMPFVDGDLDKAKKVYPMAKLILNQAKINGQKVLVSCHAGASRSALLALWCMAEEMGYEKAYSKMKLINPNLKIDNEFAPIIKQIKGMYK
jgi:protein-tyrosine phosphatase